MYRPFRVVPLRGAVISGDSRARPTAASRASCGPIGMPRIIRGRWLLGSDPVDGGSACEGARRACTAIVSRPLDEWGRRPSLSPEHRMSPSASRSTMTVQTTWKRAVGAAPAVTLALAVAACGSNGGGGSTTTADGRSSLVWNMWSGSTAEVEAWNHLGEMVTAAHPDIQLEFQTSSFNDYWTKLAAQASGGDTGCILGVQSLRARSIAPLLVPLDDMLAGAGVNPADFDQSIWKGLQVDGEQLAIPYDFGPLVMFYNVDRFREAGVPVPSVDWTVQDFLSAAQSLTTGGKYGFALYPTVDSVIPWSLSLEGTDPV